MACGTDVALITAAVMYRIVALLLKHSPCEKWWVKSLISYYIENATYFPRLMQSLNIAKR